MAYWMGDHVVDPELLRIAGLEILLWRIKDFASNLLVLKLCSVQTLDNLNDLHKEDSGAVGILSLTLHFVHVRLYAINDNFKGSRNVST